MQTERFERAAILVTGLLMLACGGGEEASTGVRAAGESAGADSESSTNEEALKSEGVASLHGRLLFDEDLSPEGLGVSLHPISPEDDSPTAEAVAFCTKDGSFHFSEVSPGEKRLVVGADDWIPAGVPHSHGPLLAGPVTRGLELVPGDAREIEIDVRPYRPCPARVRVLAGRVPARGLNVLWTHPAGDSGLIGITDTEGVAEGWCPPLGDLTVVASSRTGLAIRELKVHADLSDRSPLQLYFQIEAGSLTVLLPEDFTLGDNEQIRARLIPPGVDPASSSETLIWTERIFEEHPWGVEQAYLLRDRVCNLGRLPPGELRLEAVVDDPELGLPGSPWPEDARRLEGETTIVVGARSVCVLRER